MCSTPACKNIGVINLFTQSDNRQTNNTKQVQTNKRTETKNNKDTPPQRIVVSDCRFVFSAHEIQCNRARTCQRIPTHECTCFVCVGCCVVCCVKNKEQCNKPSNLVAPTMSVVMNMMTCTIDMKHVKVFQLALHNTTNTR